MMTKISGILFAVVMLSCLKSFSQDKRFYIFLCFGQSNMEGNAKIQQEDTVGVDTRFKVLQAVDCPDLHRTKGNWYTAVPPLSKDDFTSFDIRTTKEREERETLSAQANPQFNRC